jgi:hypothetical protein
LTGNASISIGTVESPTRSLPETLALFSGGTIPRAAVRGEEAVAEDRLLKFRTEFVGRSMPVKTTLWLRVRLVPISLKE